MSTVTPTLDGDVLAVLAEVDASLTAGQLHRVLNRYSEEGIRKVLQRLVRQGVVHAERAGRTFAYRLNRDHLAAEHIAGLARLRATFLERLEHRLRAWKAKPTYAAVFGSAARGSMTAYSDIDLLLVHPDGIDRELWDRQVGELVGEVTRWTGNDLRPLEFAAAEIVARGRGERVLDDVLRDGITVAGSRSWLAARLRRGTA